MPSEQLGLSPVQLLFGRMTRSSLPVANRLLNTATSHAAKIALSEAKARQAHYYNRSAKPRPPLAVGQTVRVKYDDHPEWRRGEIADILPHRSYAVRFEDGTTRRRTSRHVAFSSEPPIIVGDDSADPPDGTTAANEHHLSLPPFPPPPTPGPQDGERKPVITRSGRIVKLPPCYRH